MRRSVKPISPRRWRRSSTRRRIRWPRWCRSVRLPGRACRRSSPSIARSVRRCVRTPRLRRALPLRFRSPPSSWLRLSRSGLPWCACCGWPVRFRQSPDRCGPWQKATPMLPSRFPVVVTRSARWRLPFPSSATMRSSGPCWNGRLRTTGAWRNGAASSRRAEGPRGGRSAVCRRPSGRWSAEAFGW